MRVRVVGSIEAWSMIRVAFPIVALLALALVVSGCITPAALDKASVSAGASRLALVEAPGVFVAPGAPFTWNGSGLAPARSNEQCFVVTCFASAPADCGASNCAKRAFTLEGTAPARVVLAVQPEHEEGFFTARIADASGRVVAKAEPGEYAEVAVADKLPPGDYVAQVLMLGGKDSFVASLHLEAAPAPVASGEARDLLPDLVTLTPRDLRIEMPGSFGPAASTLLAAAGSRGCGPYEFVESGARRCLRFSNAVGNVGEGPMEVRLVGADEATGMVGQASFTQNIHRSDGSNRTQKVGPATYHPTHQHYHYAGLAHYDVYHYDVASHARGEKLNEGRKSGFCFLDSAITNLSAPIVSPYYYNNANCFNFLFAPFQGGVQDEVMGISPGWFDFYNWFLDDQVVEMSNAKDGTYELVSCANAERTIVEKDLENNCASVVFTLAGDKVAVIPT